MDSTNIQTSHQQDLVTVGCEHEGGGDEARVTPGL